MKKNQKSIIDYKKLIGIYTPHPRDRGLCRNEYIVLLPSGKPRKGKINKVIREARTKYELVSRSGKLIGRFYKSELYDSKEDCIAQTHPAVDSWEILRVYERKEGK